MRAAAVELGAVRARRDPRRCARTRRSRAASRGRCRGTGCRGCAHDARPRSCLRCRARRTRPGTRIASTPSSWPLPCFSRSCDSMKFEVDARARAQARVHQRLAERDVRIAQVDVLADHRDGHREVRVALGRDDLMPLAQVRWRHVQPQLLADDVVEALLVEQHRDLVDVVGIDGREHGALLDVGEERDLAALLRRQRVTAAAQAARRAGCRSSAAP